MPNRILYEKICVSETLALLNGDEERFFYRLMVQCDDYGRFDARLSVLRARCFALQLDSVQESDVQMWLEALCRVGLVTRYSVEGRPYLAYVTWTAHQQTRAKRSKYPDPSEDAKTCKQMLADADIGARNRIRYPESRNEKRESEPVRARAPKPPAAAKNQPWNDESIYGPTITVEGIRT